MKNMDQNEFTAL